MKTPALDFPVWPAPPPPAPPMTPEQYDRFLEETLRLDEPAERMRYRPVPVPFVLVKENEPANNESSRAPS
ncbi:MAG TPA: hypothetical protein PLB64_02130 [Kiritimatiellia bacterium]|nr:hypothetical protein [Kiritimatiellia bacterium]